MKNHNIDFFKIIAKNMAQNLDFLKISPKNILIFGADYSQSYNLLQKIYKKAKFIEVDTRQDLLKLSKDYDENHKLNKLLFSRKKQLIIDQVNKIVLPIQYDILWSNLFLIYKFKDIDNIFNNWIQLLNKNGMLFCSLLGLETLKEIIEILNSNNIFCSIDGLFDIQELGDKLFSYNFSAPVLYSEKIIFNYKKYSSFHQDLTVIGLLNNLKFNNEIEYQKSIYILQSLFLQSKLTTITFEILYIHAIKNIDLNYNAIKLFPI